MKLSQPSVPGRQNCSADRISPKRQQPVTLNSAQSQKRRRISQSRNPESTIAWNAGLAVEAAVSAGIPREKALEALRSFSGVKRRATVHASGDKWLLIEDYAHHPTELRCFLNSLHESWPEHRKVIVFQPHRFERVEAYGAEFARLLKEEEQVYITSPFAAWSQRRDCPSVQQLADEAGAGILEGGDWPAHAARIAAESESEAHPLVLAVIGAATVNRVIPWLLREFRFREIRRALPGLQLDKDLSWQDITTLSIGGAIPLCAVPESEEQLQELLRLLHRLGIPFLPLGCGSNMVGTDTPFPGIVIRLKNGEFAGMDIREDRVTAGAGVRLIRFAKTLAKAGLGGGEALVAVPGSIGGAVRMNAGAQGIETADFLLKVRGFRADGSLWEKDAADITWKYRGSDLPEDLIVTSADFRFRTADSEQALARISETRNFRKDTQPGGKNPGCAFRNPAGDSAGRLIDRLGLKKTQPGRLLSQ